MNVGPDDVVIELVRGASISGEVVSLEDGAPISAATIRHVPSGRGDGYLGKGSLATVSSDDGTYRLEDLPVGPATVRVEHADYADKTLAGVPVGERGETPLRVVLGSGGQLRGVVRCGREPIPSVVVKLRQRSGKHREQARSNLEGRLEIDHLEPGEYVAQARVGGVSRRATVDVYAGQVATVDFDFGGAVVVAGKVRAAGSLITEGGVSAVHSLRGSDGGHGPIDANGNYSLSVAGPGTYSLRVHYPGGKTGVALHVPEGIERLDYDIELPASEIVGVVLDAQTGQAVSGARVFAYPSAADSKSLTRLFASRQTSAATDVAGYFVLPGVPAGAYSLRVWARGYSEIRTSVLVEESERVDAGEISIEPGVSFTGREPQRFERPGGRPASRTRDIHGIRQTRKSLLSEDSGIDWNRCHGDDGRAFPTCGLGRRLKPQQCSSGGRGVGARFALVELWTAIA